MGKVPFMFYTNGRWCDVVLDGIVNKHDVLIIKLLFIPLPWL